MFFVVKCCCLDDVSFKKCWFRKNIEAEAVLQSRILESERFDGTKQCSYKSSRHDKYIFGAASNSFSLLYLGAFLMSVLIEIYVFYKCLM